MKLNNCGVYKILNVVTDDFYIGSSIDILVRWNEHRWKLRKNIHDNNHIQNAWNKYGEQAFTFEVVLLCDVYMTVYCEQELLEQWKPAYNIAENATAPMLGRHHTKETRRCMSLAQKGKNKGKHHSATTRALMRAAKTGENNHNFGKTMSEENRAKMSESKMGENNPNFGKTLTDGHRAKISAAQKGKTLTDEHRANMSESAKRRWHSDDRHKMEGL